MSDSTSGRKRARTPSATKGAHIGKRGTLSERFWRYVEKGESDACWLWQGATNNCGYGTIGSGGVTPSGTARMTTAHRVSYELHHGPIPPRLVVLHLCDTPCCVNPNHLVAGTQRENVKDAVAKGRHRVDNLRGQVKSEPTSETPSSEEGARGAGERFVTLRCGSCGTSPVKETHHPRGGTSWMCPRCYGVVNPLDRRCHADAPDPRPAGCGCPVERVRREVRACPVHGGDHE